MMSDHDPTMGDMDVRMPKRQHLEVGQVVEGTVVMANETNVFVDVGGKAEAVLESREVTNSDGELTVDVGDTIQAYVVATDPEVLLSSALARGSLNLDAIADAHDTGVPVEGKVTGVNKGGLEVDVGGARAFCPISQIDTGYCEDATVYIGSSLKFRVVEFAEDGRNIVVSRRSLLEEEQRDAAAQTQAQLQEGAQFEGRVVSLQPYGAFVDIGGVQGMVHISEIGHAHLGHPSEALEVGQTVKVVVTSIQPDRKNPDRQRIALSIKALLGDPWDEFAATLSEGMQVQGKVVRLQPFGAFVQLAPGVDGLVHISELADRRISHPGDVVEVGQELTATVLKLDLGARRISLSLRAGGHGAADGGGSAAQLTVGEIVDAVVNRIKPFGLLVNITSAGRGLRGLVPTEETGLPRGANLRRAFSEGTELKLMVTSVDPSGKIRLSIRQAKEMSSADDYRKYVDAGKGGKRGEGKRGDAGKGEAHGFGTMADALSRALKNDN